MYKEGSHILKDKVLIGISLDIIFFIQGMNFTYKQSDNIKSCPKEYVNVNIINRSKVQIYIFFYTNKIILD